jgi:phage terminase large subunit
MSSSKGKKTKGSSSSCEEEDSSFEEDVFKKGKNGKNCDKPSNNSMFLITIICLALLLILPYQLAKLPILMEVVITNVSIA